MRLSPFVHIQHITLLWVCIVGFGLVLPLNAQSNALESHLTPDGLYQIQHPEGWQVNLDSAQGFIYIEADTALSFTLYTPEVLKKFLLDDLSDDSLLRLVLQLNPYTVSRLEDAPYPAYAYHNAAADQDGLLIAVRFADDRWGLVDAYGDLTGQHEAAFGLASSFSLAFPAQLDYASDTWQQAITELTEGGLIPLGGSLSFVQNYAFAAGSSAEIVQPIAQQLQQQDVVIHADLQYIAGEGEGFGACGVMLRRNPTLEQYLALSVNAEDFILQDRFATPQMHHTALSISETTTRSVLAIARGESVTVYVDGAFHTHITPVSGGAGSFGLVLNATGRGARCEVNNFWVYALPVDSVCRVSSTNPVQKHTNPGDGDPVVGEVQAGTVYTARLQFLESNGALWLLLNDDTWVRHDSVLSSGDCLSLPAYD